MKRMIDFNDLPAQAAVAKPIRVERKHSKLHDFCVRRVTTHSTFSATGAKGTVLVYVDGLVVAVCFGSFDQALPKVGV